MQSMGFSGITIDVTLNGVTIDGITLDDSVH